jgi:hypothetical protein
MPIERARYHVSPRCVKTTMISHSWQQMKNCRTANSAVLSLDSLPLCLRASSDCPRPAFRLSRSAPDNQPIRTVTKGGGNRSVELVAREWVIVKPLLAGRDPNELLFRSPSGRRLNGANWKRAAHWSEHSKNRRVHDLRHTAATVRLLSGIDVKQVQQWLGHSTARLTIDTYSHWMGSDAAAAGVAKMNAILGDASGTRSPKLGTGN